MLLLLWSCSCCDWSASYVALNYIILTNCHHWQSDFNQEKCVYAFFLLLSETYKFVSNKHIAIVERITTHLVRKTTANSQAESQPLNGGNSFEPRNIFLLNYLMLFSFCLTEINCSCPTLHLVLRSVHIWPTSQQTLTQFGINNNTELIKRKIRVKKSD